MSDFIKAEKVVSTSLGILERKLKLAPLVWRDAGVDFRGAKGDTVTLRLPAYAPARTRALRSGATRTKDALFERKVDLKLDTDIYKWIGVTDEQMNLDIENYGAQIIDPMMRGVANQVETTLASSMSGATYEVNIAYNVSTDDPYEDVAVPAKLALDAAHVPEDGRVLFVGSTLEAEFLNSDKFVHADKSGSTDTLRRGVIGFVAGFAVVAAGASIAPNTGYAFHRTAYALSMHVPAVPTSATWGAVREWNGYAMRFVRGFDMGEVEDQVAADVWVGATVVKDDGYFDSNGIFIPTTEPGETLGRSVTLLTSAAADDIIDATAHGFTVGDEVEFPALTGGAGLATDTKYYVIAANLAANTFQVSLTPGGSAATWTTDITAGTVRERARSLAIRALKITAS